MEIPACRKCGGAVRAVKVGPDGHAKFFAMCMSVPCRTNTKTGILTEFGDPLSDGHDAPYPAEKQWAETARRLAQQEQQA